MKFSIILFLILALGKNSVGQSELIPTSYQILDSVQGDLNKDGIDEKVVIYNITDSLEEGEEENFYREIIIFKKEKHQWTIWQRSNTAVGSSKSGGMNGDPYWKMEILKGVLSIYQSGGSRWKWAKVDKYRYQHNAFELIGHTSHFGTICEYWLDFDYNLMTGKVEVKKEYEKCENQQQLIYKKENEKFVHRLKNKITLQNRNEEYDEIISPKYKHDITL
jgi:hypothetical protein